MTPDKNNSYTFDSALVSIRGSRWEYDETVKKSLSRVNLHDKSYKACGLPVISDGQVAYVNNDDSHALIIGSTGSKKSRLFAIPMMNMFARAGESVLCTDPKGELFNRTSGLFEEQGYKILVINLRDPVRSHGWNPLRLARQYCQNGRSELATELVNDLAMNLFPDGKKTDPFWAQSSRGLFRGLCEMLIEGDEFFSEEEVCINSLPYLLDNLACSDSTHLLPTNSILSRMRPDSMAQSNLRSVLTCSDRTFDNVIISYNAAIQALYSNKALSAMLSTSEIDFGCFGREKTVMYLIMPDEKTTYHMIVSLIVKHCYESLIAMAQNQNGALKTRVNFLLDEFSNLPTIPDMSSMISAARSRNIRFYIFIQSMHQLLGKYGDDAYTIRGNCNDWVFLTSRELAILQELEILCGINARTNQPLISLSQLQRLDKNKGETLILCGRLYPYISYLADIDDYPFSSVKPACLPTLVPRDSYYLDVDEIDEKSQTREYLEKNNNGTLTKGEIDLHEVFSGTELYDEYKRMMKLRYGDDYDDNDDGDDNGGNDSGDNDDGDNDDGDNGNGDNGNGDDEAFFNPS